MKEDLELLDDIGKNVEMGMETIPILLEDMTDNRMQAVLQSQLSEYEEIHSEVVKLTERRNGTQKGLSHMQKAMSDLSVSFKTMADHSPSHLAEMMIQGSTMGTIQITKKINRFQDQADHELLELGKRLLKTEERNVQELKTFL